MSKAKKISTKEFVEMALLVAIIIIMAFTPIGYIKTAGLEITLIVVPVAVGAVVLGPTAGAILGGVFGITSFIQCFGMSAFGTLLLGVNPVFTFLVCVPTRILDGWLTGLIFQGLRKTKIPSGVSVTLANLCCPLLNTAFFMGTLVTLFAGTMREQFGMTKVIPFIAMFVGINGVIEALVCFVIGTAVSVALKKALR
jgi:uncharacterized membrane protein